MAYVTHVDLAESPGALELAQVASAEERRPVDAPLLEALLRGQDTSGWPGDEQAAAHAAVQRIDAAVQDAQALIDGYLAKRGYALPLAPVHRLVTSWARAIARYVLHKNRLVGDGKDPVERAYRDALRLLELVAQGKFSLGADDAVANDGLDVRLNFAPPVFGRAQLKAFR